MYRVYISADYNVRTLDEASILLKTLFTLTKAVALPIGGTDGEVNGSINQEDDKKSGKISI